MKILQAGQQLETMFFHPRLSIGSPLKPSNGGSRLFLGLLTLFIGSMLVPTTAQAQRIVHRVRFAETLSTISKYYYGNRSYGQLLRLANDLPATRKLKAGDRIRIPTAWVYTVRRTTSIKNLAQRLLGDKRRWPALSLANKVGRRKRIRRGTKLIVPYRMAYTAKPGDTFNELSERFFGTKKFAKLIAIYNFTNTDRPTQSSQIEIPISHLQILPRRLESLVNTRLLGITGPREEDRQALQEANAMLRRGEYWGVPLRLIRQLSRDQISDRHVAEVFKLLATAYVAVDRHDLAVSAFQEALLRLPTLSLDPVTTSPKVMRAFVDAKTRMQRGVP
jgi:hypothetical protein